MSATPRPWWNESGVIHARGPDWTPENHSCIHVARVEKEEDAELIAAAPEMLAALEEGRDRMKVKGWCPFCTMLEVDTFFGHEHDPDCRYEQALALVEGN